MRNCLSLESIEVTQGNTATQPPYYIINDQHRQPDQPRTLPNGGYNAHDFPCYKYIVDQIGQSALKRFGIFSFDSQRVGTSIIN